MEVVVIPWQFLKLSTAFYFVHSRYKSFLRYKYAITQPIACSKLAIEALEQGTKYVQS